MDTFVFAVGNRKAMGRLQKELQDLVRIHSPHPSGAKESCMFLKLTFRFCLVLLQSEFCGDKPKSGAKYSLPDSLAILSEMGEVTDGVMDSKVRWRKIATEFDL